MPTVTVLFVMIVIKNIATRYRIVRIVIESVKNKSELFFLHVMLFKLYTLLPRLPHIQYLKAFLTVCTALQCPESAE